MPEQPRRDRAAARHASRHHAALLILDLISDFEFDQGDLTLRAALPIARPLRSLKRRLKKAGMAVIYVNDEIGPWRSDRQALIDWCMRAQAKGQHLVRQVLPDEDDYFILKPKHSGFFATPLNSLLQDLGATQLILTGITSHQCVLFTAIDAYVRDYKLTIPRDCVSAARTEDTRHALHIFKSALGARTLRSSSIRMPR
jgi:nicotinamidase-related amidase